MQALPIVDLHELGAAREIAQEPLEKGFWETELVELQDGRAKGHGVKSLREVG